MHFQKHLLNLNIMKSILKYVLLFIFFMFIITCKKDEHVSTTITPPPCWQKFVGTYSVKDTANNIGYVMTIAHFSTPNTNGGAEDTLVVTNFANKFDFKYHFTCYSDSNFWGYNPPFPCYDHFNKRWSLSINPDDTITKKYENQLKNDTIILYFNLDNIAFYYPDGVPYYSANQKHIAVKQH